MRPRTQHHGKPVMTKAANRASYEMWLHGAAIDALGCANPASIGSCYGIPADQVAADIAREPQKRAQVAAQFEPQRLGEPQS